MLKWLLIAVGTISVIGGLITFWLPVPLGVPLFLVGVPLLMKYSPHARYWILQLARGHPRIAAYLEKLSKERRK